MIHKNETYDATLCNPPFHDSAESARAGANASAATSDSAPKVALNFGGQQQELWCEGAK